MSNRVKTGQRNKSEKRNGNIDPFGDDAGRTAGLQILERFCNPDKGLKNERISCIVPLVLMINKGSLMPRMSAESRTNGRKSKKMDYSG